MINLNLNKLLNELGFDYNPEKMNNFIEKANVRDNIMKSKTITGAFAKLSDEDKKSVVDSLNSTQNMFDSIFGIKSRPWTIEDLDGAYVNVRTNEKPVADAEKKEEKPAQEASENQNNFGTETGKCGEHTIATSLADEFRKKATKEQLVTEIVNKAIEKFVDKQRHEYTLKEVDSRPAAVTYIRLLQHKADDVINDSETVTAIRKSLEQKTGSKNALIGKSGDNSLEITIIL